MDHAVYVRREHQYYSTVTVDDRVLSHEVPLVINLCVYAVYIN